MPNDTERSNRKETLVLNLAIRTSSMRIDGEFLSMARAQSG